MMYLGDFNTSSVVRHKFTTEDATGAASALSGATIKIYKDGSTTTEVTTGLTTTLDFDGLAGLNEVSIDTSADGTFYAAGSDFFVILTVGTVNSIAVGPKTICSFSINNRNLSQANIRSAVGLGSANLDTQIAALAAYVDTEVAAILVAAAAIKLQTDKLTFDASNNAAANVKAVNDTALDGVGTSDDPWGPA